MGLLLPEIDANTRRLAYCDHHRLPPLAEIRMPEHDFMSANAFGHIPDWRFTNPLTIDPHLRPRLSVDAENAAWQIHFRRGGFSRRDMNRLPHAEPKCFVREFDVVI